VVEQVAIKPTRLVATARAAKVVSGSSQVRGALATSSPTPSESATNIESNSPASALRATST
jgi:hypothetical protein